MRQESVDYLDMDDLLAVVRALHTQGLKIRDPGLLASALARPQASAFGDDAYPGMPGKAAALMSSLVGNHALVDGNTRLGLAATALFYWVNGFEVIGSDDDLFDLTMEIADGLSDVEVIAARLEALTNTRGIHPR